MPQKTDTRSLQVPSRGTGSPRPASREAAVQYMRAQIDKIYDGEEPAHAASAANPYQQTHSETAAHTATEDPSGSQWQRYHSAWQSYYQQYYERYYLQQLHARQNAMHGPLPQLQTIENTPSADSDAPLTKDAAVSEIRSELLNKVSKQSAKLRGSRHFMPIMTALIVVAVVALLQYNRLLVAQVKAYVSPGSIAAQNLIIDPTTDTKVGPEPRLIIPKINVDAPVVYGLTTLEEGAVQKKLESGVVHYPIPGASSHPGQKGNTVVLGHSSNDVFDNGDYKFVFVQLDQLKKGDTFYMHYQGTRYTYSVTDKEIIDPTEVNKLVKTSDKPLATLVTCTPPGTALKRLVVYAEQISPDPTSADTADNKSSGKATQLPGNSPSFFERLFSGN